MDTELKLWAEYYYNLGFNITCITNQKNDYNFLSPDLLKSPNHIWYHLIFNRQNQSELKQFNWEQATGIGCVLGHNNIRCLDIDGLNNIKAIYGICEILGLSKDYEWIVISGSKKGAHIYLQTQDHSYNVIPGQTKAFYTEKKCFNSGCKSVKIFERIELRWKYHMVLPPSIHNSYNRYSFWKRYYENNPIPKEPPKSIPIKKIYFLIEYLCKDTPIKLNLAGTGPSCDHYIDSSVEPYKSHSNQYYLVFDTETNGLPENTNESPYNYDNWPRLIQISWYLFTDNAIIVSFGNYLIYNQYSNLKIEVTKLTGIENDMLRDRRYATPIDEVLSKFKIDLSKADYFISHNVDFDKNVVSAEFIKNDFELEFNGKKEICTMRSSTEFCHLENNKWPTLEELYYSLFKEEIIQEHNAKDDVKITAQCFWELKRKNIINLAEAKESCTYPPITNDNGLPF